MPVVEDFLDLPYHITLVRDQDDEGHAGWVGHVVELPGCVSQGRTPDEAIANMRRAMEAWIDAALEDGDTVPQPVQESYNGRILLRVPATLHEQLLELAKIEGVSLNHYIASLIAGAVGWPRSQSDGSPLQVVTRTAEQLAGRVARAVSSKSRVTAASGARSTARRSTGRSTARRTTARSTARRTTGSTRSTPRKTTARSTARRTTARRASARS
jgi:antitoxin HicB